jgi:hypothetical protein
LPFIAFTYRLWRITDNAPAGRTRLSSYQIAIALDVGSNSPRVAESSTSRWGMRCRHLVSLKLYDIARRIIDVATQYRAGRNVLML